MSVAYRASAYASSSASNTLTISKPTGTVDNDVMLAFAWGRDSDARPALSAPAGWTLLQTENGPVFTDQIRCWWKRAASEGESYDFTKGGTTANADMDGFILSYSGCRQTDSPVDTSYSQSYQTNNTTIKAYGVTTTVLRAMLVFLGANASGSANASTITSLTERLDQYAIRTLYAADGAQASPGASGDKDATMTSATVLKHAFLVALAPVPGTPTLPSITSPTAGYACAPGTSINLTAYSDDPDSLRIKYAWTYAFNGGADQEIDESDLTDSGDPATVAWDTTGLSTGTYLLKCTAENSEGGQSAAREVTIYLAHALITAPADEASQTTGYITLTAKGYSTSAGQIRIQWEIDTNTPPDDESDDYDLITSELTDQGESVSVAGNVSHLGTWYVRARAQVQVSTRYNRCNYPSFERDINSDGLSDGWTYYGYAGSPTWTRPQGRTRGYCQRIQYTGVAGDPADLSPLMYQSPAGAVTNGDDVTVSFYLRGAVSGCTLNLMFQVRDSSGVTPLLYATPLVISDLDPDTWQRYSVTYENIAHASASSILAYLWASSFGEGDTLDIYVDDVLIEATDRLRSYFDGDDDDASWAGNANASASSTTYERSDWSSVLTVYVLEALNLRPGSQVAKSIIEAANRVYVRVDKADPVIIVSATNDTGDFAHSTTPREIALIAPDGTDETGAQAIANKQLALRGDELTTYSGLQLELCDGMKLSRGQRVGIQIDRMGVNVTTVIRNLVFDIPSDTCTVTVGDFNAPQDVWDAFLSLFQEMQALRKEGA